MVVVHFEQPAGRPARVRARSESRAGGAAAAVHQSPSTELADATLTR